MTRTRLRAGVTLAGLVLLAGYWLAPQVPLGAILYLSIVWTAAAGFLLYAGYLELRTWLGGAGAAVVILLVGSLPVLLTAIPVPPGLALRLPCPRDWGRLSTWHLRPSPMGSVSFSVGDAKVKVCYGRPALRGRPMIGGKYVPFGRLWRTGANEPTIVISTAPFDIAGIPVPRGRSSLYTVPGPETWEVILGPGRAILRSETSAASVERLTLVAEPQTSGRGMDLIIRWESTVVRIPMLPASR